MEVLERLRRVASAELVSLTPEMLFNALAAQINGPEAWDKKMTIEVIVPDGVIYTLWLSNGASS